METLKQMAGTKRIMAKQVKYASGSALDRSQHADTDLRCHSLTHWWACWRSGLA